MSKTRKTHQPHNSKAAATVNKSKRERSTLLTIAIILVIVNHVILAGLAYYDLTNNAVQAKSLYMPILLLTSVASIAAGVAMWFWKSWGFQLYIASALVAATSAFLNTGYILVLFASVLPPFIVAYIYLPLQKYFD